MKRYDRYFLGCLIVAVISATLANNGYSTTYGSPISNRKPIPIGEVFDHPAKYHGKTVTLKGRIDMQDEKGHWFYLAGEDARIYVDLYTSDFVIPEVMNKTVLVEGKIEVKMNVPSLFATGVEW